MKSRAIVFSENGEASEKLYCTEYELPPLGDNDVLMKLMVAPINPADQLMVSGWYRTQPTMSNDLNTDKPAAVLGLEGVFEIEQVGAKVTRVEVGDWALGSSAIGSWQTRRVMSEGSILPIKSDLAKNLTPVQAGTVCVNPTTAEKMLLDERVGMKTGDYFVQNGANSHLGRLAIQLGKKFGFKSINVVRNRSNLDELVKELKGLGADHVVTDEQLRDQSFVDQFKSEQLGGQANVKLALNCVGGAASLGLSALLSDKGVLTTYGAMTSDPMLVDPGDFVMRGITFQGYWLSEYIKDKPMEFVKLVYELLERYAKKELIDSPVTCHELSEEQSKEEFLATFFKAYNGSGKNVLHFGKKCC